MGIQNNFEDDVQKLIDAYGKLYFFKQALDKQKVTRQIINTAKYQHMRQSFFIHMICFAMIGFGLTGYSKFAPMEILFLIPTGFFFLWFYQIRFRRFNNGLRELEKLATGIHARKLQREKFKDAS